MQESDVRQQFADKIQRVPFATGENKEQHTGTGIPLVALLLKAGLRTQQTPKHYDLSFFVIVEAHDGYRAYFSLAELLPANGHASAFLIWDVDGKPLPAKETPFRLIAASDRDADRSIYGIATIRLVDGTKLANQLSKP